MWGTLHDGLGYDACDYPSRCLAYKEAVCSLGIDPAVETYAQDSGTQCDNQEEQELQQITRQYLTNERFRSLVHQLHAKMEASAQVWEF